MNSREVYLSMHWPISLLKYSDETCGTKHPYRVILKFAGAWSSLH